MLWLASGYSSLVTRDGDVVKTLIAHPEHTELLESYYEDGGHTVWGMEVVYDDSRYGFTLVAESGTVLTSRSRHEDWKLSRLQAGT